MRSMTPQSGAETPEDGPGPAARAIFEESDDAPEAADADLPVPTTVTAIDAEPDIRPDEGVGHTRLSTVIGELEEAKDKQRTLSWVFGAIAVVAVIVGVSFLAFQAAAGIEHIESAANAGKSDTAIGAETLYLIIRGTGTAAIVGGIIYFLLGLARSSIDQATRYEKRLIASHLIDYALHDPAVDASKLDAAYKIVEVWGSTVESAYTPPRVAKRIGGMELALSRDGGSMKTDASQP